MLSGSWCAARDRNRSTTPAFAASSAANADHCSSNQSHKRPLSSGVSDAWIRLSGLPGARPSPSVLNENEPSTTCCGRPSPFRRTTAPCGTGRSARRTSTVFSTHSAQRPASQRPCSRLRAARSAHRYRGDQVPRRWAAGRGALSPCKSASQRVPRTRGGIKPRRPDRFDSRAEARIE